MNRAICWRIDIPFQTAQDGFRAKGLAGLGSRAASLLEHMDRQSVVEPRRRTVRRLLGGRPWWINLLWIFCLYMTFIYMPFDFFLKPTAEDREVWFGVALTGFWAKATEPFHWVIYALGAWGFWGMRPWMWPWAAAYSAQVATGMLVWNLLDARGRGWLGGTIAALIFMVPTVALWRAKPLFSPVSKRGSN